MKKDVKKTDVIFRKFPEDNQILALFPYDLFGSYRGIDCISYMHIGQHGPAEYSACLTNTIPAKEMEYKPLFEELESMGYNLNVIKRRNYKKFLSAYNLRGTV
jgi:hypothetical protein